MVKLFLDIETIPADNNSEKILRMLYAKKEERAGKKTEDFEEYFSKTSFDGAFGRILCIGYAINDEPEQILYNENNEAETLRQFWEIAKEADLFIGHNVMDFDLRFIFQRSIINKVKPPSNLLNLPFARYRNNPIFDTMKEWVKWANSSVGLEHIALAMGIPTPKDGIDGSQVFDFYKKGKVNEILEYCKRDVETTREVYRRIAFINE